MSYEQYAYTKYNREVKKLPKLVREKVVEVQEKIAKDPLRGKPLRGELKGWRSYPFTHGGNSYRIAYKVDEGEGEGHIWFGRYQGGLLRGSK